MAGKVILWIEVLFFQQRSSFHPCRSHFTNGVILWSRTVLSFYPFKNNPVFIILLKGEGPVEDMFLVA